MEKDSEVPANLCIIEFIESYKVNLFKDYGHFQLKMTENGLRFSAEEVFGGRAYRQLPSCGYRQK